MQQFIKYHVYLEVRIEKHQLQANQINSTSLKQGYNAINLLGSCSDLASHPNWIQYKSDWATDTGYSHLIIFDLI